jgi:PAS domain S-box-containing protein
MNKSSSATSSPLLAIDFLVGCSFPLVATLLDIWWKGQPFSFAAALAAQTSQPLLWLIDCIPLLLILWQPGPQAGAKKTASAPRSGVTTEQQITERTAKLTKQIAELKAQSAYIRQEREELRVSEEIYRSLVENTNDSLFTLSLDGTFTTVNTALTSLLGKHRDDLMGRHCSSILPSASLAPVEEQIRKFQGGEKTPATLELSFFHQNGKMIEVEVRFLPTVNTEGNAIGLQGICRPKAPAPAAVGTSQTISSSFVTAPTPPENLQGSFINSTLGGAVEPLPSAPSIVSTPPAPALSLTPSFYAEATPASSLVTPSPSPSVQVAQPEPRPFVSPAVPQPAPPPVGIPNEQLLDLEAALSRVDGDRELLVEMADLFLDEYPRLLSTLRDAVAQGNAPTAAYAAHTLKGSVANFSAMPAFTAAQKIERIARQGDLTLVHAAFSDLETKLTQLKPVLMNLKMGIAA